MMRRVSIILILAGIASFGIFYWWVAGNVARYRALEEADPLFAFNGVAPEELAAIGGMLDAMNAALMDPGFAIDTGTVYPASFWQQSAAIAEARTDFYQGPGLWNAIQLVRREQEAAARYLQGITEFRIAWRASLEKNPPHAPDRFFLLPGVETDSNIFYAALDDIEANARRLAEEADARLGCIILGQCPAPAARMPIVQAVAPAAALLPDTILQATREIAGAIEIDPHRFATSSNCFSESPQLFVLWNRPVPNHAPIFFPKLATNSFYRPLDPEHFLPQDSYSIAQGLPFAWQPETNPYLCPDITYYQRLLSLRALWNAASRDRIAPDLIGHVAAEDIRNAEENFLNAPIVSDALAHEYIDNLQTALGSLPAEHPSRARIQERVAAWRTQSVHLPDVFRVIEADIDRLDRIRKNTATPLLPITVTLTHSFPTVTFAAGNPSVWRAEDPPRFITAGVAAEGSLIDRQALMKHIAESMIRDIESATVIGTERLYR